MDEIQRQSIMDELKEVVKRDATSLNTILYGMTSAILIIAVQSTRIADSLVSINRKGLK